MFDIMSYYVIQAAMLHREEVSGQMAGSAAKQPPTARLSKD